MDRREFVKRAGSSTLGAALLLQGTTVISAQAQRTILFIWKSYFTSRGHDLRSER
jgi:hypothetical protein